MYLVCRTRPNIAFIISQLNKHNADPRNSHLQVIKKVIQYFYGIIKISG